MIQSNYELDWFADCQIGNKIEKLKFQSECILTIVLSKLVRLLVCSLYGLYLLQAIIFAMTSGQMWNHIRGPPVMHKNPSTGQVVGD